MSIYDDLNSGSENAPSIMNDAHEHNYTRTDIGADGSKTIHDLTWKRDPDVPGQVPSAMQRQPAPLETNPAKIWWQNQKDELSNLGQGIGNVVGGALQYTGLPQMVDRGAQGLGATLGQMSVTGEVPAVQSQMQSPIPAPLTDQPDQTETQYIAPSVQSPEQMRQANLAKAGVLSKMPKDMYAAYGTNPHTGLQDANTLTTNLPNIRGTFNGVPAATAAYLNEQRMNGAAPVVPSILTAEQGAGGKQFNAGRGPVVAPTVDQQKAQILNRLANTRDSKTQRDLHAQLGMILNKEEEGRQDRNTTQLQTHQIELQKLVQNGILTNEQAQNALKLEEVRMKGAAGIEAAKIKGAATVEASKNKAATKKDIAGNIDALLTPPKASVHAKVDSDEFIKNFSAAHKRAPTPTEMDRAKSAGYWG